MVNSVESVEPSNDISLEGWTDCNVSAFPHPHFLESSGVFHPGVHQLDNATLCLVILQSKSTGI